MKKYTKRELLEIFIEIKKYTIAGIILKRFGEYNHFQIQVVNEAESWKDLDKILSCLTAIERNLLKANVSAKVGKFLKDYEKLGIHQKQKFLSENSDKLLLSAGENIQKILE